MEYNNTGMRQFIYEYWIWNIDEIRGNMVFVTRCSRREDGSIFSEGSMWIPKEVIKWCI